MENWLVTFMRGNITLNKRSKNLMKPLIGYVGMTHLSLVSSIAASEKNFHVVCFDFDSQLIDNLQLGKFPVSEPMLKEYALKNSKNITFTSDQVDLRECDIIYIASDVATDDDGNSDLSKINYLLDISTQAASRNQVLVILSQVPPGYTRSKNKTGIKLYYQVETLIFGQAIERSLSPERFIIGCPNLNEELPQQFLNYLLAYSCPILKMRYESAELAKIAINMYLVASVSTTNTLSELCESIGASWSEISPALRLDKRIGKYSYLNPGLGISGGNLERDLSTVLMLSDIYKTDSSIVAAWLKNSSHRKNWIWSIFKKLKLDADHDLAIALLGLAYKENTHSLKNSPASLFLSHLKHKNIKAYDPAADNSTYSPVIRVKNLQDAIAGCDVLVLATAWQEFKEISVEFLLDHMRGRIIIDPYGLLEKDRLISVGFTYYRLGE